MSNGAVPSDIVIEVDEANGGNGIQDIPVLRIVTGGIALALHTDPPLDPLIVAQIERGNDFILALARALTEKTGASILFTGTSIGELAAHLERITGMTLQELAIFLNVVPPPLEPGSPLLVQGSTDLAEALAVLRDFNSTQSFPIGDVLATFSNLLLSPTRVPGEKCLAPAPLLRDLLDLSLGKIGGLIPDVLTSVIGGVQDLLIPAFTDAVSLTRFVQAVLDDPITAALNLVLGQRNQIECIVEGALGVADAVFDAETQRLIDLTDGILV